MGDRYGTALEFDVDLHSIYAAYLGHFETNGIDWWDKSWGGYFLTFNDFLGFGWEVMTVVDAHTGRPHIAVRKEQIALFAKMIRTRFGEVLPKDPPTILPLEPVNTKHLALRRLLNISDLASYRKLALTLPAAELNYIRTRVRAGEPGVISQLFYAGVADDVPKNCGVRDNGVGYTWACVKTTWWERGGPPYGVIPGHGRTQGKPAPGQAGKGLVLEIGLAVLRCPNLHAVDVWPPNPGQNFRKSHFITEEWVDKRANTNPPSYPRNYAFGKSRFVNEKDAEKILDANLSSIASQENDNSPNTLILLHVGDPNPLPVPTSSTLPSNVLNLDLLAFEYNMRREAQARGLPGAGDRRDPLPNLASLLQTLQIPVPPYVPLGNAGNEAFYTLLAFQKLLMADTRLPDILLGPPQGYLPYSNALPVFPPPQSMSMVFPAASYAPVYPSLLPPQFPDSRRSSYASQPTSPARPSLKQGRKVSDDPRPRPVSFSVDRTPMSTPANADSLTKGGTIRASSNNRERATLPRSRTVFWDDAEYAPAEDVERTPGRSIRPSQATTAAVSDPEVFRPPERAEGKRGSGILSLHAGSSSGTGTNESSDSDLMRRGRGKMPPSAMRGPGGRASRSISWDKGLPLAASSGPRGAMGGSDPSSPQSKSKIPLDREQRGSLGSSTGSGSERRISNEDGQDGGAGDKEKGKGKGKEGGNGGKDEKGKGKLKQAGSVKNLAGALARFWTE
ncbi:hypothetical protein M231_03390 [Tremella mesenterica]|uniref:Gfd2/YDR514C-like C-terminal domain-containing protein n=1 Tax=Tremella mesenterica TaxID=5217 RepID=A0A4Q1BN85_TREME|nr:hypothetical protein M231_03390 [Tremella mesenterica]